MIVGKLVKVVAPGTFNNLIGSVTRVTQHHSAHNPSIWVAFIDDPFRKPGAPLAHYAFKPEELEYAQDTS